MKTYLLTAPDLEELVIANKLDTLDDEIRLYYVTDEVMSLSTMAKIYSKAVSFIHVDSPAEIVFDIGKVVGQVQSENIDIEIFCSDRLDIPENLMKTMNIKSINAATKKTTRAKKESKSVPAVSEKTTKKIDEKVEVEKPKRGRKPTAEKAIKDTTKTAVKKSVPVKAETEKKTTKKSETKTSVTKIDSKPEKQITVKAETKTPVTNDVGTAFLKQMSVRGSDLKDEKYSDDALLQELVSIFKNDNSIVPVELSKMLNDTFSETDAKIVYDWVKPNAKKLHELALQF